MAIRFRCRRCAVLLSIGARKAGAEIRCPRCGAAQVVPTVESRPEQQAMPQPGESNSAAAAATSSAAVSTKSSPASPQAAADAIATSPSDGSGAATTGPAKPMSSDSAAEPRASASVGAISTAQPAASNAEPSRSNNGDGAAALASDSDPPGVIVVYDYEEDYEPADEEIESEVAGNPPSAQIPSAAAIGSSLADTAEFIPPRPAGGSSAERVFSEQPPRLGGGSKASPSAAQGAASERGRALNPPDTAASAAATNRQSSPGEAPTSAGAATNGGPASDEMVYLPRKIVFAQAWFLLATCAAAFAAGYWIGGGRPAVVAPGGGESEAQSRVFVEGLVAWTPMPGQTAGDENAVVILLPADRPPEPPIPMSGLRPVDPMPGELHRGLRAIKKAGGDYTRTDAQGRFGLVAPTQGRYRVLVISRHAGRVENAIVQEADFNEIGRYLQSPEMLVGRYKYQWREEEVRAGFAPLEINFGQDGKE